MPPRSIRQRLRTSYLEWRARQNYLAQAYTMPPNVRNEIAGRMAGLSVRQAARRAAFMNYVNRVRSRIRSRNFQARAIARGINPNTRKPFRYSRG